MHAESGEGGGVGAQLIEDREKMVEDRGSMMEDRREISGLGAILDLRSSIFDPSHANRGRRTF